MLSKKENFLETVKKEGAPDRLVDQWEAVELIYADPINIAQMPEVKRGGTGKNNWGMTMIWPEDQPTWAPYHTEETILVKDVSTWRDQLEVPVLDFPAEAWAPFRAKADEIDRSEKLPTAFMHSGLFERLHGVMGFEGALTGMLEFPEEYLDLCKAIGDERIRETAQMIEYLDPEMILFHDDWGMKHSLFMNPKHWRKFIKPHYVELYKLCRDADVLVMHHADSFLEPIAEDLVELGIDIWQGALPENDIPKLQEQFAGRLTMMGGIDASLVDRADTTEAVIRGEARRACAEYGPGGHFIPCMTYGGPDSNIFPNVDATVSDEIGLYNKDTYGI
ncbi:MAG: uroporphyrinogen decarboxylase (URO-D) [Clostridiales Family XIII bacterium]|jgi:hypothetical protein|nr:uroporphyrinogen decarboxylase (URO-D) [Clostridiales Family XIII bacterium]